MDPGNGDSGVCGVMISPNREKPVGFTGAGGMVLKLKELCCQVPGLGREYELCFLPVTGERGSCQISLYISDRGFFGGAGRETDAWKHAGPCPGKRDRQSICRFPECIGADVDGQHHGNGCSKGSG